MPTVMELGFMALHALEALAKENEDGNAGALIRKAVVDLTSLPAHYHRLMATLDNEKHAAAGAASALAASEQAHRHSEQLAAHIDGRGASAPQREHILATAADRKQAIDEAQEELDALLRRHHEEQTEAVARLQAVEREAQAA